MRSRYFSLLGKLSRSLFIIASATTMLSSAASACQKWKVSGKSIYFRQSNGHNVGLSLNRKGNNINGSARWTESFVGKTLGILWTGQTKTTYGRVDGVIIGNNLDFRIDWNGGLIGIYKINIDPHGRGTGTTYDFRNPNSRADIIIMQRLSCLKP